MRLSSFTHCVFVWLQNGYALRRLYVVVNLCEERVSLANIISAVDHACPQYIELQTTPVRSPHLIVEI